MAILQIPGTIVRGVDNQGLFLQLPSLEGFEDLTDTCIQFFYGIAIEPPLAAPTEGRGSCQRNVRHGVREIEKKGLLLMGLNKRNSLLRVTLGQGSLITRIFYYFLISHEGYPIFPRLFSQHFFPSHTFPPENFFSQWGALIDGHVIAVGNPKIMIESLSGGEKIRMMPQVPFANAGRCVTSRLQHLGQRDLIGVQPGGIFREKHSRNMDPSGITTGEQCGPRG